METVKIKQNKKALILMIIGFAIGLIVLNYNAFIIEKRIELKIIYVLGSPFLLYAIFMLCEKLVKNERTLQISESGIEIDQKKQFAFIKWTDIIYWKIKTWDEKDYLIIKTEQDRWKIDLSWLDKKPEEIKEIISSYTVDN